MELSFVGATGPKNLWVFLERDSYMLDTLSGA